MSSCCIHSGDVWWSFLIVFLSVDFSKFCVQVTSAYGNSYHYSDHVTEGHFAFQAVEAGDYMACFFAADNKPSTSITIDFDWKSGVAAKDWTNVAKKGSVEVSGCMHML